MQAFIAACKSGVLNGETGRARHTPMQMQMYNVQWSRACPRILQCWGQSVVSQNQRVHCITNDDDDTAVLHAGHLATR